MTPLCPGGILRVDLTMPIVTACSQFLVYVGNFPSLCMMQFFPYHKHMILRISFGHQNQNYFSVWSSVTDDEIVGKLKISYPNM